MAITTQNGFDAEMLYHRRPRLLVVDDEPINIRLIHNVFHTDHDVFMATDGEQALQLCATASALPDLILLDVVMPGLDGLELCRLLKKNPQTWSIPVIFVTAHQSSDEENACWDAGGVDFVNKPINLLTLRNRVKSHLTLKFQTDHMREMAFVDGLTGVANRRHFEERLDLEFRRCRRSGVPLAILMLDVDFFKRYNDCYGHQAGDECLRRVAATLKSCLGRPGDLTARYGGEEFICLLPEIDWTGAEAIGEKMVAAVRSLGMPHRESEAALVVTVSAGMAVAPPSYSVSADNLIAEADAQLYRAKREGRNRLCGYWPSAVRQTTVGAAGELASGPYTTTTATYAADGYSRPAPESSASPASSEAAPAPSAFEFGRK